MRRLEEKVLGPDAARSVIAKWRADGVPVVLAIGAFDPLEAADARDLAALRPPGARLVVGVSRDDVVATLGAGRPVVPFEDRCRVAAALAVVDLVVEAGADAVALSRALGLEATAVPGIARTPDLVSRIRARLAALRRTSP